METLTNVQRAKCLQNNGFYNCQTWPVIQPGFPSTTHWLNLLLSFLLILWKHRKSLQWMVWFYGLPFKIQNCLCIVWVENGNKQAQSEMFESIKCWGGKTYECSDTSHGNCDHGYPTKHFNGDTHFFSAHQRCCQQQESLNNKCILTGMECQHTQSVQKDNTQSSCWIQEVGIHCAGKSMVSEILVLTSMLDVQVHHISGMVWVKGSSMIFNALKDPLNHLFGTFFNCLCNCWVEELDGPRRKPAFFGVHKIPVGEGSEKHMLSYLLELQEQNVKFQIAFHLTSNKQVNSKLNSRINRSQNFCHALWQSEKAEMALPCETQAHPKDKICSKLPMKLCCTKWNWLVSLCHKAFHWLFWNSPQTHPPAKRKKSYHQMAGLRWNEVDNW